MNITVYYAPGSCSRAILIALEEIGIPYGARVIAFMKGEHHAPDYLAMNPKGKVPLLLVDGAPLTESVAIFGWLAEAFPDSALLPPADNAFDHAKIVSDLAWATSALHGLIGRLRFPMSIADKPEAFPGIVRFAADALAKNFAIAERRLENQPWWYDQWSAMDAYLFWAWTRAADGGFDGSAFPRFADHAQRMMDRPAVQKALAQESLGQADLEKRGAALNIPAIAA